MGFHLQCDDGLGRGMAIFSYIVMILGHLVLFLGIVRPKISDGEVGSVIVEYLCYCFFWVMMVLSHISTMCVDPGFIPKGYKYRESTIAAPFQTISDAENAFLNRANI